MKYEDRVTVNWRSDLGTVKRGVFKVGAVSRPQISVNRLQETSHDVILTKNHPHVDNMKTVKIMPLRKHGGMFILDRWIWVPSRSKTESSEQGITMLVKGAQFLGSILTRVAGGFDLAVKPGLPRVIAQDAGRDHGGKTTALVTNATVDPFQVLYTGGPSLLLRRAETQPVIWSDPAPRRKHAHVEEAGQRSLGNDRRGAPAPTQRASRDGILERQRLGTEHQGQSCSWQEHACVLTWSRTQAARAPQLMRSRAVHTRQRCGREPVAVLFSSLDNRYYEALRRSTRTAAAALQVSGRQGPGRLTHIEVRLLAVQDW